MKNNRVIGNSWKIREVEKFKLAKGIEQEGHGVKERLLELLNFSRATGTLNSKLSSNLTMSRL